MFALGSISKMSAIVLFIDSSNICNTPATLYRVILPCETAMILRCILCDIELVRLQHNVIGALMSPM